MTDLIRNSTLVFYLFVNIIKHLIETFVILSDFSFVSLFFSSFVTLFHLNVWILLQICTNRLFFDYFLMSKNIPFHIQFVYLYHFFPLMKLNVTWKTNFATRYDLKYELQIFFIVTQIKNAIFYLFKFCANRIENIRHDFDYSS